MGHPQQDFIAYDKKDLKSYLEKYLHSSDIYISVYKFMHIEKGVIDEYSAYIDKVFFDLDSEEWVEDMIKLHKWCEERNLIHRFNCSGRGGHFFVFTKPQVQYKSNAIFNFVTDMEEKLSIEVDPKIKGDLRRIFRLPNTYNFKGMRFCVPINEELLYKGKKEIYKFAKKPKSKIEWYGKRLMDLAKWDKKRTYGNVDVDVEIEALTDVSDNELTELVEKIYDRSPSCIKYLMGKRDCNYKERYHLILYLKEQKVIPKKLSKFVILKILKEVLSKKKYYHMSVEEGLRPFNLIMRKDYYLPNCDEWKKEGLCPDDECDRYNPRYETDLVI